jgi:hypothetical protein
VRSWTSSTVSPLRVGYHSEDQESLISGNNACSDVVEEGRGCKPVPARAGEYHSAIPMRD